MATKFSQVQTKSIGPAPVGAMIGFAGRAAPPGWLLCDGRSVSRSTYAALFTVIGTNYGAGDGVTTFNVPDSRRRTMIGADTRTATGMAATATLATTTPIVLTARNVGTQLNGMTFSIDVLPAAANPTNTVLAQYVIVPGGHKLTITPNNGGNNSGTPVNLTTAQLVELINTSAIATVTVTVARSGVPSARWPGKMMIASGGGPAVLADGGEGDGLVATFAGGFAPMVTRLLGTTGGDERTDFRGVYVVGESITSPLNNPPQQAPYDGAMFAKAAGGGGAMFAAGTTPSADVAMDTLVTPDSGTAGNMPPYVAANHIIKFADIGGTLMDTAVLSGVNAMWSWQFARYDTRVGEGDAVLPASPADGDKIGFKDVGGACSINRLRIHPSGKTINGIADDLDLDRDRAVLVLAYVAATGDWTVESYFAPGS